ncbi:hypothetical protein ACIPSA_27860 [Streptomyces sp. NPDC086549]|uniref:hypothetical protein n=1 Tax=Streptomyces sp. NPDC086549 TaxID=3365752 RepID=UPI00380D6DC5
MSTLYDSLVSQGELEQAHQAAFQETCARALRVSYWTEYLTPFVKRLHIINSSPDPVSEADLLLWPAEGLSRLPDDWTVKSVGDGDGPLGITGVTEGTPGVLSVKQAPSCGDG